MARHAISPTSGLRPLQPERKSSFVPGSVLDEQYAAGKSSWL
jgi:hypothetical protein